jgi:hypothetical protein
MIGTNSNNFFSRRGRSLKKKSIMKKTIGAWLWELTFVACLFIREKIDYQAYFYLQILFGGLKKYIHVTKKSKNGDILINFYLFNMTLGNMSTCIYWHKFGNPDSLVKIYLYYSIVALLIPHS